MNRVSLCRALLGSAFLMSVTVAAPAAAWQAAAPGAALPAAQAPAAPESDVKQTVGVLAVPDAGGEIERGRQIREAEALRRDLHKTTGIAPLWLRRLDAALAVIATPTSTTAELQAAETELDAFVAIQQAKSPSREAPAKKEKPYSSWERTRSEISMIFARNSRA